MRGGLLLGADYRGLGVARSLGRKGIPVALVTEAGELGPAAVSRFCGHRFTWPGSGEQERVSYLLRLAAQEGLDGWVIFPTRDEPAAMIARNHQVLAERFVVSTPAWEIFRYAYDKRLTYQLAAAHGIQHPVTRYPRHRADVEQYEGPFPVILKPATKPQIDRLAVDKAWRVDTRSALLARYDEALRTEAPDNIMLQELVPGRAAAQYSMAALCVEGRPLASVVAQRVRQYPMEFGRSSSFVETIDDPQVEDLGCRLLAALRFTGLAEIEFMRHPSDGRCLLLDMNARVWGWHTVARRAGLDFPYLVWRMTAGEVIPDLRSPAGLRWLHLATDVPAVIPEVAALRMSAWRYLGSLVGSYEHATLAADDPLPGLLELPMALRGSLRHRFRAHLRLPDSVA